MTWLRSHFAYSEGAISNDDIHTIHQYCRAYIVDFFGSCIFADRSGAYAHLIMLPLLEDIDRVEEYAWGAAALSWSYRELGRTAIWIESGTTAEHIGDIGGWLALLQVWALERFPSIARRVYSKRKKRPESLGVPHFGLRAAPPPSTLVTLAAGWRCSRCGLWRDFPL
ncbi:Protein MAIN-LIKE 2 [Linum perenne]